MQIQIKSNKDRVEKLLREYPETRDNYNKILANIWYIDLVNAGYDVEKIDGAYFLTIVASGGTLTNPESIRRNWQKLQQDNPELRGETWEKRQGKQSKVKEELGYQ